MTTVNAAQGSETRVLFKKQSGLGALATGNYNVLRYNTHSLDVVIGAIDSAEIRSDREVVDFRHGGSNVAGTIASELCFGDHEALIESAMFQAFSGNTVQIGTAKQYLSIEDGATDITVYRMFQDVICSKMTIDIKPNAIVSLSCDMVGLSAGNPGGTSGGGTPVAASTNDAFDSFSGSLYDVDPVTGSEIATITDLTFSVDNQVGVNFVVGQQAANSFISGQGMVSGQFTALFDSSTWLSRFLNEAEVPLVTTITDPASNFYKFEMGRVKISDLKVPVTDMKNRIITAQFRALRDPTLGTALKITKS